jgi:hypothetical protein
MNNIRFLFIALLTGFGALYAQVGINSDNSSPDVSAMLDVKSTDKGLIMPRMTFEQRNGIQNPADGLMVYCTNCSSDGSGVLSVYENGQWYNFWRFCETPTSPTVATNNPGMTQITWNWNAVPIAIGYKWNTVNNYSTAFDMENVTTYTETGLTCQTNYTRYVWAYNDCGNSSAVALNQSSISCCGLPITINHAAGVVAPVTKLVTYEIVNEIPGEPSKCWITQNLGADHQASAVNDNTEASAGWYWQFNRKQGYKHDGVIWTPSTTWITSIIENSDWTIANDPCSIELEGTWRIPTYTEWYNIKLNGAWQNWNGPWDSPLKMHAAGYIYYMDGSLNLRGNTGFYWSGTQSNSSSGRYLSFTYNDLSLNISSKAMGFSLRCVREN